MADLSHEVEAIPEDLGNLVKGDVKLGKFKIPKIAIAGGVIGVVAFIAIRARGKGGTTVSDNGANSQSGNGQANADSGTSSASSGDGYGSVPINDNPLSGIPSDNGTVDNSYSIPTLPSLDLSGLPQANPIDSGSYQLPIFSSVGDYSGGFGQIGGANAVVDNGGIVPPPLTNKNGNTRKSVGFKLADKVSKAITPTQLKNTEKVSGGIAKQITPALARNNFSKGISGLQTTVANPLANAFKSITGLFGGRVGSGSVSVPNVNNLFGAAASTYKPSGIPTSTKQIVSNNNSYNIPYKPSTYSSPKPSYNIPYKPSTYNSPYVPPKPKPAPVFYKSSGKYTPTQN